MYRKIITTEEIESSSFGSPPVCQLTLTAEETDSVTLILDRQQYSMLNSRFSRQYLALCKEERMYEQIDAAPNCRQLENLVRKYSLCDVCDFSDINLYGVKRALKVLVRVLYRYPKLRSKLCYIGSPNGYFSKMDSLAWGDKDVLKDFGLQYICQSDIAIKLGRMMKVIARNAVTSSNDYVAMAVNAFGLFDAVLLDQNDYEGYAYIQLVSRLRQDVASGFAPEGCHTPEAIVYHELGHMLDYMCDISESRELLSYVRTLSSRDVENGLSRYAATSTRELIAEAFAEYMCNDTPRSIARKIGSIVEREYAGFK